MQIRWSVLSVIFNWKEIQSIIWREDINASRIIFGYISYSSFKCTTLPISFLFAFLDPPIFGMRRVKLAAHSMVLVVAIWRCLPKLTLRSNCTTTYLNLNIDGVNCVTCLFESRTSFRIGNFHLTYNFKVSAESISLAAFPLCPTDILICIGLSQK